MRLTKQMESGEWIADCKREDAIAKLADYETAEEQGRLLIAPCDIGDTVWAWPWYNAVMPRKGRVTEMRYNEDMRLIIRVKHICNFGFWGENVFATKEEAEAAWEVRNGSVHSNGRSLQEGL